MRRNSGKVKAGHTTMPHRSVVMLVSPMQNRSGAALPAGTRRCQWSPPLLSVNGHGAAVRFLPPQETNHLCCLFCLVPATIARSRSRSTATATGDKNACLHAVLLLFLALTCRNGIFTFALRACVAVLCCNSQRCSALLCVAEVAIALGRDTREVPGRGRRPLALSNFMENFLLFSFR